MTKTTDAEAALVAAAKLAKAAGMPHLTIARTLAWGLREALDLNGAQVFDELADGLRPRFPK